MRVSKTGRAFVATALAFTLAAFPGHASASYSRPRQECTLRVPLPEPPLKKVGGYDRDAGGQDKAASERERIQMEFDLSRVLLMFHENPGKVILGCIRKKDSKCLVKVLEFPLRKVYQKGKEQDAVDAVVDSLAVAGSSFEPEQKRHMAVGVAVYVVGGLRIISGLPGGADYIKKTVGILSSVSPQDSRIFQGIGDWALSGRTPVQLAEKLTKVAIK